MTHDDELLNLVLSNIKFRSSSYYSRTTGPSSIIISLTGAVRLHEMRNRIILELSVNGTVITLVTIAKDNHNVKSYDFLNPNIDPSKTIKEIRARISKVLRKWSNSGKRAKALRRKGPCQSPTK